MSYELHIERLGEDKHGEAIPIPLDAWKTAVSATSGVRLCTPGIRKITYPHGTSINFPIQDGDLEVYFPEKEAWEPVFHWRNGSASVNASFDPGDSSDPVWTIWSHLRRDWVRIYAVMMENVMICRQVRSLMPNFRAALDAAFAVCWRAEHQSRGASDR